MTLNPCMVGSNAPALYAKIDTNGRESPDSPRSGCPRGGHELHFRRSATHSGKNMTDNTTDRRDAIRQLAGGALALAALGTTACTTTGAAAPAATAPRPS